MAAKTKTEQREAEERARAAADAEQALDQIDGPEPGEGLERNEDHGLDPLEMVGDGKTVTVACKLPHGMIMQIHKGYDSEEPVFGGGVRKVTRFETVGSPITLNGNSSYQDQAPGYSIRGGFALTHNVPAKFFRQWCKEQKDSDFIKKGLVYACSDVHDAEDKAKEHRSIKSGLERLDRNNLPRVSRRIRVETHKKTDDAEAA